MISIRTVSVEYSSFFASQNMVPVVRQFHDGMLACVRFDDRVCSRWFAVEQGLCQGCMIAPLVFHIFFAAVINVTYMRFKGFKVNKKSGGGGTGGSNRRRASTDSVTVGHSLR